MTTISSQTFAFSPPQENAQMFTQPGIVSNVPLDGSTTVTVPFLQPFAQACISVVLAYQPATETDYHVVPAVIGTPGLSSFVLSASGGPAGTTGTFTFQATGI